MRDWLNDGARACQSPAEAMYDAFVRGFSCHRRVVEYGGEL